MEVLESSLLRKWPCERKRRSLGRPVLVAGLTWPIGHLPIFPTTPYINILPNIFGESKNLLQILAAKRCSVEELLTSHWKEVWMIWWQQQIAKLLQEKTHNQDQILGWSDENTQLRPSSFAVWSELFHPIRLWRMCLSSLWTDDDQSGGSGDYNF